jgi:hypothetical protein
LRGGNHAPIAKLKGECLAWQQLCPAPSILYLGNFDASIRYLEASREALSAQLISACAAPLGSRGG